MFSIYFNFIRDWLKTRVSGSLRGIVLSAALHIVLITFPGSIPLVTLPDTADSLQKNGADLVQRERNGYGTESKFSFISRSVASGTEKPLLWSNPVFAQGELGRGIATEKGRVIKTHTKDPPSLRPPEFNPYIPPAMEELAIDPDHDVLKRTLPVDYDRNDLEHRKRLFRSSLAEDLQDCRLDTIALDEALLKLRYFRLQEELLFQGKKPDFSYEQVRNLFNNKIEAVRQEINDVSPENWATSLLLAYRKDKIYEEKRGHSLFNSIWYDLYNCRSGSEELLMYLNRYHPGLELGTVRGSVKKYDGTVMGHMDPAVKINGRWVVIKTVALDTVLVEEYKLGELYPLEKTVLDYLPDFEDKFCGLSTPLARNGEPLAGDFDLYTKNDHPLAVKDKAPSIILRRESSPYRGPYRMMGREDRLLHDILIRYQPLTTERKLLNEDDPYADLLFHLLKTAPDERQSLLGLYLRKRVNTYPTRFKRPLRTASYIPGYGDLLATMEKEVGGKIELTPGNLVPLSHFSGHGEYLSLNSKRMAELTRVPTLPTKLQLKAEVREFLFTTPKKGITAIFPPFEESRDLVAALLNDAYDLSMPAELERARRTNDTSSRGIAILKAGLSGQPLLAQNLLEQRITLLQNVLANKAVHFAGGEARSRHEITANLSFADTLSQSGRLGLSPGFIKDMVELMGEGLAVQAFLNYLQSMYAADVGEQVTLDRQRTAETIGYFDRYLLLEKSRKKVVHAARQLYKHHPDIATRVGAAQFLVSKGALDPARAGKIYDQYLAQKPFDVRELRSLLETGLTVEAAIQVLHDKINKISLKGKQIENPDDADNVQVFLDQLKLDELMRGAIMLGDDKAQQRIARKLIDLLMAVFDAGDALAGQNTPHYSNGLNSLSALSRSDIQADEAAFSNFVEFGSRDPAGFLFAKLMKNWFGPTRYRGLIAKELKEKQAKFVVALDDLSQDRSQLEFAHTNEALLARQVLLANYGDSFQNLVTRVAEITFLNGLAFLDGQVEKAYRFQTAMLADLFKQVEFHKSFALIYDRDIAAVRDDALLNERMFRTLELAGYFAEKSGKPGELDLNHAPTIRIEGEFLSPCGSMEKTVDGRNAPQNLLFTKAGIYFDSLLDAENSPALVAEGLHHERKLRELMTKQPLVPGALKELDDTESFFQGLAKSDYCDIRRLYVLEKLLKRAVLPEKLPNWILNLAYDSYDHEMKYLARINKRGGVEAIFEDYRTMDTIMFRKSWGEQPFSIRNFYGTLVLLKLGHLKVNSFGKFVNVQ